MNGEIDIRPARPGDCAFLAWVMLAATRGHLTKGWFDITLDMPEPDCLAFLERLAQTRSHSWWHWSHFHVAEADGVPLGALCAFRAGEGYALSQIAMDEVTSNLGWSEADVAAMWSRAAYIFSCAVNAADDVWAIENVAVKPEARKKGIGRALTGHALRLGREAGCPDAQLSVLIGNIAARKTYEAAGFALSEEKRHADFERAAGGPGLWCFRRAL